MPSEKLNLCAIIPVYNHPDKLDYLVDKLSKLNLAIIMIDDGSNAECCQTIKRLGKENSNVKVQTHLVNMGKGAAIKTGINMAQKAGFSHALQIDADAQHDLNDIPRFIESMKKHPDALIAGYPLYDETIPGHRYFGRYATHIWVWINTLSMSIKDSMCGFRIYPVPQSWQLINKEKPGNRMEYDIEFIVRWHWTGQPLVQIPTKVIYPEHGLSHFRLVYDNCLIFLMHARLFFGMLLRLPKLLKKQADKPMNSSKHWADIAETTTVIGIRILIFVYRVGGPLLFRVCLFPVICFYFLFRNDSRQASEEYLEKVQKKTTQLPSVTWLLSFRHFWQFGLAQIDKFAIWTGKISVDTVVLHNSELAEQLIQNKQGGIFAVSHLGNLEICHALTQKQPGLKLTMLVHTKHAEKFNRILNQYTNSSAVKIIQVTDMDAAVAMQLSEKTEQGEFVAIAADRVPVSNQAATIPCDFLGEQANFPRGPFVLASILAVPMILLICIKQQGVYHMYFETLSEGGKVARSDRENFISHTAQTYARKLEHYTRKEPLQWFNFYDFWHKR